jgi:asparagine synthase (glutamine-hydrolysing)
LYIHESSGATHFAGELNDLLALLPNRPVPDDTSVAHWIAVSNRPGSQTLYAGVRRLAPGSMLAIDRHGAVERRYWEARFREPSHRSPDELGEQVREAIDRSVRRRVSIDRDADQAAPIGVLMSGGLDSAAVAAVASEQAPGRVAAYAGLFPEHPAVDESSLIAQLRDRLGLPGVDAEVRAGGVLASVIESLDAWDAPPHGWGDFWSLPLLRAAATAGVRVMLGGDGGDELFATRTYLLADKARAGRLREMVALASALPGAGNRPPRRALARMLVSRGLIGALPYGPHDAAWRSHAARQAPPWLRRERSRAMIASDDPLAWKRLDGPRWWAHAAHGLTHGVDEAGVFEHHRRRAALAGIEARHPLFDLDLLELALRLPPQSSFDPVRNRPLLRASMIDRLPDSVRLRPAKAWFDSLITDCLAGADGPAVRGLLCDRRAELRAYVDQDVLRRALFDGKSAMQPGTFAWMHQTWRLLTAECWLRREAGGEAGATLEQLATGGAQITLRTVSDPSASALPV